VKKRRVAIYTGNRAEYGMQYPILKTIANDERFEYYLLVSGAHLDTNFGHTIKEIKNDGFNIYATVDITMGGDTLFDTTQAIGSGILNLSNILEKLKPDFLVVYADRFEGFSALITGTQMGIPTAHIEGGDITEGGALDDTVRHSMTKLAHLHFTTNEKASERIRRMGEEPWRVFTVGFPGIDLINEGNYANPQEIERRYHINPKRPLIIYTQHSIATEFYRVAEQLRPSIEALARLAGDDVQILMTFPNNDAGGFTIAEKLRDINRDKRDNIKIEQSLGRYFYYGFLNLCGKVGVGACVGNSSSGIKETPAFGCPVVNIGERQKGRLRSENVIDVGYDTDQIYTAVKKALYDKEFRKRCREGTNPYGIGGAGKKIADVLASVDIDMKLLQKKMTY